MKRRLLVKFQLIALALVLILLVGRNLIGSGKPNGFIVFDDLDARELQHTPFVVDSPVRVAIQATGSFEQTTANGKSAGLAAYGWIVRRDTREVVWAMDSLKAGHGRGLVAIQTDTLLLQPGIYEAYYTSYGNQFNPQHHTSFFQKIVGSGSRWQNDKSKWVMAVRPVDGNDTAVRIVSDDETRELLAKKEGTVWTSAPMDDDKRAEYVFELSRPLNVNVFALGEINGGSRDFGWIEDAVTGQKVWEMDVESSTWAGGARENRRFDKPIPLQAGIYRAVFETNGSHAFDNWEANPPFYPADWGLTLSINPPTNAAFVSAFDPWKSRQPIIRILQVTHDNVRSQTFRVAQPVRVVIAAEGEITETNRYDYGWLENDDTRETVWDMGPEGTVPAGGNEKNRAETAFLELQPGTYTLNFQTDDSHSFDDWNSDPPEHPERWGVALFPLSSAMPANVIQVSGPVRITQRNSEEGDEPLVPPAVPPIPVPGDILVKENQLGNDADKSASFKVDEPTSVFVYAVGEFSENDRIDYGWIEKSGSDERVWDMTWQNTQPAGGDQRNRQFVGNLKLEPGEYKVRFKTDMSHAFGDFDDNSPADPNAWGIVVSRVP